MNQPASLIICLSCALIAPLVAEPPAVTTITIKTLTAQMKYDTPEFTVAPGAPVHLQFENGDDLPHNIAFCKPGTDVVAMSMKQMEKPEEALKRNWLPDDASIWAHSKLLNPHDKEELRFTAPETPGIYPYVCTFPGHAATMRGQMKVFPLGEGLKDLTFKLYLGDWSKLPDFAALSPHREGKVEGNLIEVKLDDYKNHFGVVFEGTLDAPKKGNYNFYIASDDGSRVLVDGKRVVESDGIHPSGAIKSGNVKLEPGKHAFRLEYFQGAGEIELFAAWKGPDFEITPLSKWLHPEWQAGGQKKKNKNSETTGMPLVVGSEPVLYRNFIAGAGNRGIAVGYPGGVNIAWSAESMNLALVWRGAFMDAARHWNSRGGGHQAPLGYDVLRPTGEVTPALFATENAAAEWPRYDKNQRFAGFTWKGYELDASRAPTFRYEWNGTTVEDRFRAEGNGTTPEGKLIRTVKFSGPIPANTFFRIGSASKIEPKDGAFLVDGGKFSMDGNEFPNQCRIRAEGATLAGTNLVVPIKAAGQITITYQWAQ